MKHLKNLGEIFKVAFSIPELRLCTTTTDYNKEFTFFRN